MRLWIFSDLHRGVRDSWEPAELPSADAAVVAGDVREGLVEALDWLAAAIRPHMPVVFVPGNHEFYGTEMECELERGRQRANALDISMLQNSEAVIEGVRFLGGTLWTDYELERPGMAESAMVAARRFMNDHRHIAVGQSGQGAFTPEHALRLHLETRQFLDRALARRGPSGNGTREHAACVVVTHHAPHPRSIHPRFAGHLSNAAFASDLTALIAARAPDLWVHGHTHASLDYRVGATRIVCNPKGYGTENGEFDPALVVEV